nr:uncharacterized protein LOC117684369 [Crassostrea gigas]
MIKILQQRENISLFNHSTTVKNVDVYGNGSKTNLNSSTNPCAVYSDICNVDETCDVLSGNVVCVTIKLKTTDWSTFLIILGVTIPLAMTTVALAIIYVCHKRKSAQKKDSAIIRDNDYAYLSHSKDSVQDQYCTIDQYGDIYRKNPKRGYDNSDYWKSINDLLNRQEQFRIKRPTTRIN